MSEQTAMYHLEQIVQALKAKGYDPYAQLTGYLQSGDDAYITRHDGARELIRQIDKGTIWHYLSLMFEQK